MQSRQERIRQTVLTIVQKRRNEFSFVTEHVRRFIQTPLLLIKLLELEEVNESKLDVLNWMNGSLNKTVSVYESVLSGVEESIKDQCTEKEVQSIEFLHNTFHQEEIDHLGHLVTVLTRFPTLLVLAKLKVEQVRHLALLEQKDISPEGAGLPQHEIVSRVPQFLELLKPFSTHAPCQWPELRANPWTLFPQLLAVGRREFACPLLLLQSSKTKKT